MSQNSSSAAVVIGALRVNTIIKWTGSFIEMLQMSTQQRFFKNFMVTNSSTLTGATKEVLSVKNIPPAPILI